MYLKTVDSLVEELPPGVLEGGPQHPHSPLLQALLLSLLRDTVTACQQGKGWREGGREGGRRILPYCYHSYSSS